MKSHIIIHHGTVVQLYKRLTFTFAHVTNFIKSVFKRKDASTKAMNRKLWEGPIKTLDILQKA